MAATTKITIPKPCQENWLEMSPLEQGRFCLLCQKNVIDFTNSSDREILEAFKNDEKLCGRFSESQLDRDLLVRKEKSSIWTATTAAIVSFIGLGTNEVVAQENVKVEQTDKKVLNDSIKTSNEGIEVSGIVYDEENEPIPGLNIIIKGTTKGTQSNFSGEYKIKAKKGDVLIYSFIGYNSIEKEVKSNVMNVNFKSSNISVQGGAICVVVKKRTFFGRIFHSIGNWFR